MQDPPIVVPFCSTTGVLQGALWRELAALRLNPLSALLLVHIDGLERLRQSRGRGSADRFLALVAQEIVRQVGTNLVGRTGEAEFAVLVQDGRKAHDLVDAIESAVALRRQSERAELLASMGEWSQMLPAPDPEFERPTLTVALATQDWDLMTLDELLVEAVENLGARMARTYLLRLRESQTTPGFLKTVADAQDETRPPWPDSRLPTLQADL